jgi:hypothetical protein
MKTVSKRIEAAKIKAEVDKKAKLADNLVLSGDDQVVNFVGGTIKCDGTS